MIRYVNDCVSMKYHGENKGYLCHYGIPNMRWYHRRYQNPDGSLTAAGRERYGVGDDATPQQIANAQDQIRSSRRNDIKDTQKVTSTLTTSGSTIAKGLSTVINKTDHEYEEVHAQQKSKALSMSEEDMKKEISRIKLENEYAQLTSDRLTGAKQSGREKVTEFLDVAGSVVSVVGGAVGIATAIQMLRTG